MSLQAETKKELEDFAVRLAGAFTGAAESAATEIYNRANPAVAGQFPYTNYDSLAPWDNWIVGGLAIPPWVVGYLVEEDSERRGDMKTKGIGEAVRKFGEGDACYSFALVLHHSLVRMLNVWPRVSSRPIVVGQNQGQGPQELERARIAMERVPGQTSQEVRISDGSRKPGIIETIRVSM